MEMKFVHITQPGESMINESCAHGDVTLLREPDYLYSCVCLQSSSPTYPGPMILVWVGRSFCRIQHGEENTPPFAKVAWDEERDLLFSQNRSVRLLPVV